MFQVKEWNKSYLANTNNKKKTGITILILDKINFQTKGNIRNEEGHFIMVKTVNSTGRYNNSKLQWI